MVMLLIWGFHFFPPHCTRQWATASFRPAGFDDTIICTLRAAVRQPAPAGCRAAARGGLAGFNDTIFCTLWAAVRQWLLEGAPHYMALPPPSNCQILHFICPTPTLLAVSGESIPSPVGPLSFFCGHRLDRGKGGGAAPSRCGLTLGPPMGGLVR